MPNSEVHQSKGLSICKYCGKEFPYKSLLEKHVRQHTGEKPFKCEICHRGYSRSDNLRQHKLQVHSGERPFECDVCHSTFAHRYKLVRHEFTHSGEKPIKCQTCQKFFSRADHLQVHERKHRSQKNQYKTCDGVSSSKAKLNDDPLECGITDVRGNALIASTSISFTTTTTEDRDSLELPLNQTIILSKCSRRKIFPAEALGCEYCRVRFTQEKYFVRHMLKHFGEL